MTSIWRQCILILRPSPLVCVHNDMKMGRGREGLAVQVTVNNGSAH